MLHRALAAAALLLTGACGTAAPDRMVAAPGESRPTRPAERGLRVADPKTGGPKTGGPKTGGPVLVAVIPRAIDVMPSPGTVVAFGVAPPAEPPLRVAPRRQGARPDRARSDRSLQTAAATLSGIDAP